MEPAGALVAEAADAFRVQVAAVAAQQAALFEEESRLEQQQAALNQQQEQLAAHLDEKRQRVMRLADQVNAARVALQKERQDHAHAWAKQAEELGKGQHALDQAQQKLLADRRRVTLLRRRLKQHFQRCFAAERQQLHQRESAVSDQHRRIESEAEKLQREREILNRDRLATNGDMELAKRQIQAERKKLQLEQQGWQDERQRKDADFARRAAKLRQREQALADNERALSDAQHSWKQQRKIAEQEASGLETRIVHLRRKLSEFEQGVDIAQSTLGSDSSSPAEAASSPQTTAIVPPHMPIRQLAVQLDRIASDLADERLVLVEHWQRLALTQREWEQSHERASYQLEALASSLPAKEEALLAKTVTLENAQAELRQRQQEIVRYRQHLEGWAARIRLRETAWQCERDRLLADLHGREETAEKHFAALVELRQSWAKRRRQEIEALRVERGTCEKLRQEFAALRQECWKRGLSLAQQERELAEKTLALEESRQQFVLQSPDAAAAESRLERIRKRWSQENAAVVRTMEEQLQRLQAESGQIHQRGRELLKVAEELAAREATLAQRQTAWEESLTLAESTQRTLRQQLQVAHDHRARALHHVGELQTEIERLARVLLESGEETTAPPAKAA